MRLFIAAELPEDVLEALAETSALLRSCMHGRFVAPDSFHVTLAFLGEVNGHRIDDACRALSRGCAGFSPFTVSLGDLGCFGKRSKATLWQGFHEQGSLSDVANSVRDALSDEGFSFDEKTFLPHVTLMRAADVTRGTLPMPALAEGDISSITLFRSDLSGNRPVYDALHTCHLAVEAC